MRANLAVRRRPAKLGPWLKLAPILSKRRGRERCARYNRELSTGRPYNGLSVTVLIPAAESRYRETLWEDSSIAFPVRLPFREARYQRSIRVYFSVWRGQPNLFEVPVRFAAFYGRLKGVPARRSISIAPLLRRKSNVHSMGTFETWRRAA